MIAHNSFPILVIAVVLVVVNICVDVHGYAGIRVRDDVNGSAVVQPLRLNETLGRISLNFNYGWRFRFGHAPDGQEGPAPCVFTNISSQPIVCTGLDNNPNRFSVGDCAAACCYNPECYLWTSISKSCFHGGKDATCVEDAKGKGYDGTGKRASVQPIRTDYEFAKANVNDSNWEVVDAPHDFLITNSYFSPKADMKHGHIMRNVSWYTKHFYLPSEFENTHVFLHFEGIFHVAQIWVNGVYQMIHTSGYTGFTLRLDNMTIINFGSGNENIINIRVDATFGSGHWYEGGGIYRPVHLVSVSRQAAVVHNGLFVWSEGDGSQVVASAELENLNKGGDVLKVDVDFVVRDDGTGTIVAAGTIANVNLNPNDATVVVPINMIPSSQLKLWSIKSTPMYNITASVRDSTNGVVYDVFSTTTGFRSTSWSGATGFYLNNMHMKFRGFSNHNSFAGVGVAMAPRLNLFRVQNLRALGGNIWRMSHNPYVPHLYNLLDRLGVLSWDENRDYGPEYVPEMHDMVKRDRNHPSIVVWGFCNEVECNQATNQTGLAYNFTAKTLDPTRPTAANDFTYGIDVQGWSHANSEKFISSHEKNPNQPLVLSECCSCQSQRVGDRSVGTCEMEQNSPGLLPYVTGSLGVWTLMDYFGEPAGNWPFVSCSYGQFDIAGFPKPHAYWYHVNWLALKEVSVAGRPAILPSVNVSRILSTPSSIALNDGKLTVHSITNSEESELVVDGKTVGTQTGVAGNDTEWTFAPPHTPSNCSCQFPINATIQCRGLSSVNVTSASACQQVCCDNPTCTVWQFLGTQKESCWIGAYDATKCYPGKVGPWEGGATTKGRDCPLFNNMTVIGRTGSTVDSTHTVFAPLATSLPNLKLSMRVDAPSPNTGTGTMLAFDGVDSALIAVEVVDEQHVLVDATPLNITFTIVSGPGRITGSGNGDPSSLQLPYINTKETFGGMARVIVQVTQDCISANRALIEGVDVDGGKRTKLSCNGGVETIVVGAHVEDQPHLNATITIQATSDPGYTVQAFVKTPVAFLPNFSYLNSFEG
eukprot:m.55149 g.55149  ORF g.55149 m.55149 type:complete len:1043 (-) comp7742_c0_seq2:1300-4428(-)